MADGSNPLQPADAPTRATHVIVGAQSATRRATARRVFVSPRRRGDNHPSSTDHTVFITHVPLDIW